MGTEPVQDQLFVFKHCFDELFDLRQTAMHGILAPSVEVTPGIIETLLSKGWSKSNVAEQLNVKYDTLSKAIRPFFAFRGLFRKIANI